MRKYLKLESIIKPVVKNLGYIFLGIEFISEKKIIRIFIDKKKSFVSLEDCELVGRNVKYILTVENYGQKSYFVEVSSRGINNLSFSIQECKKRIGSLIKIHVSNTINDKKEVLGKLLHVNRKKEKLYLQNRNKIILLYFYQIDKIKII